MTSTKGPGLLTDILISAFSNVPNLPGSTPRSIDAETGSSLDGMLYTLLDKDSSDLTTQLFDNQSGSEVVSPLLRRDLPLLNLLRNCGRAEIGGARGTF